MKPKPLVSLNHFTFPVFRMSFVSLSLWSPQTQKGPS
jgi:hypothetical protein